MEKLTVIGAGPGGEGCLTPEAREEIGRADIVYAAERHAHLAGIKPRPLEPLARALEEMRSQWALGAKVAVVVSGDPALYSLLPALVRAFGRENLRVTPGTGALQALCAALKEPWQDAAILSAHGRELSVSALAHAVRTHERTFLFCDQRNDPAWLCAALRDNGLSGVEIAVGERLTYPDGRVVSGSPEAVEGEVFDPLCLTRVLNPRPVKGLPDVGIPDGEFVRGKTPMTKKEIRALALVTLKLKPNSVVWDVGAGTGSVSVECARQCPEGEVYAVERDENALSLIQQNAQKFFATNLRIVPGRAPEALSGLPAPTHVFLGGSGGEMGEILSLIERLGVPLRLAATAVTLESAYDLAARLSAWKNIEAAQVAVSRLEPAGAYYLFKAQNPVFLFSADWEGAK
jgi:precorrin-6Y C5,15-methyltransferase (decarboxylating)